MAVRFDKTSGFSTARIEIENNRYKFTLEKTNDLNKAIDAVDKFADDLEAALSLLEVMYKTPREGDMQGEKSSPFANGRYRLYFRVRVESSGDFLITLIDVDDNKQSNLDRYPTHKMKSFDYEDS